MLELVLRCTCKINDLCKFWIMFHCCFIDNFANWIIEPFTAPDMSCVVHIQSNDTSTSKGKVILQILGLCSIFQILVNVIVICRVKYCCSSNRLEDTSRPFYKEKYVCYLLSMMTKLFLNIPGYNRCILAMASMCIL